MSDKPDELNLTSKISTWVFGIAYNKALKSMSKAARRSSDVNVDDVYQDIARILNCPENTVKTRMFHARKKLQAFAETQET